MKRCLVCKETEGVTRDHVVPRLVLRMVLERETYAHFCSKVRKGNIQPLCGFCNNYKATRVVDLRDDETQAHLLNHLFDYGIYDAIVFEDPDEYIKEALDAKRRDDTLSA